MCYYYPDQVQTSELEVNVPIFPYSPELHDHSINT